MPVINSSSLPTLFMLSCHLCDFSKSNVCLCFKNWTKQTNKWSENRLLGQAFLLLPLSYAFCFIIILSVNYHAILLRIQTKQMEEKMWFVLVIIDHHMDYAFKKIIIYSMLENFCSFMIHIMFFLNYTCTQIETPVRR